MTMLDLDRTATYIPRIDWDGDGDYDLPAEDLGNRWLGDVGIEIQGGRDQARSLAPPMIDSADLTINNADRAFSPEYPGSPVYQLMRPGRTMEIVALWGLTDSAYRKHRGYRSAKPYRGTMEVPLFTGVTANMTQDPTLGRWSVQIPAIGALAGLRGRRVTIGLMENVRSDQCVTAILDAVGWAAGKRQISVGDTTLLSWWSDDEDAWLKLMQLQASEGAGSVVGSNGAGDFIFQNRNYRSVSARSTTSQATFSDVFAGRTRYLKHQPYRQSKRYRGIANALNYSRLSYDPAYDNIVNRCTMAANRRALGSSQVVWEYGSSLAIPASATETITARTADPFKNALAPVGGTDYLVISGSVTAATISQTSGTTTTISITAGAGGATIGGLQLRAQPLQVVSSIVIANDTDQASSIDAFGERSYQVDAWPEIDLNQGQSVVNAIVARYATERPIIEITVPNIDATHMRKILDLRVSDRITILNHHLGIRAGADLFIESIHHRVSASGQIHEAVFGCERATSIQGARWDISLWDALTSLWGS